MNKKTYNMKGFVREKTSCGHSPLVRWERILSPSGAYSQSVGNVLHTLRYAILLMMVMTGVDVWGQTDYSGTYFIANDAGEGYSSSVTTNNYYMVPAANPQQSNWHDAYYSANYNTTKGDPEKPFIATYKTHCDNNSIWQIISAGNGYYYLKHWLTGKYLIYEPPYSDKPNRKSVHLQTTSSPGDNAKFAITGSETKVTLRPISLESGNRFLNPAANNSDNYYGSGGDYNSSGLVGVWSGETGNSVWHLEKTVLPPSFTISHAGDVTITSESGTTLHYLTNGTDPTASSTTYSNPIVITNEMTAIKALAVRTSDSQVSNIVTLPLQTYTYHIVNSAGDIAIEYEGKQAVGKTLTSYLDIPAAIQSPYLEGEAVSFYTLSETYDKDEDQLNDENKITKTPPADADIYVTYTTDHLADKFLKLRGARAFNIKVGGNFIYNNNGTLASESTDANQNDKNHLWYFSGNDPYAVQVKNAQTETDKYLIFSTAPTFSLGDAPIQFILMSGSTSGDGSTYDVLNLREATGSSTDNHAEVSVYTMNLSNSYYLIDKVGKLIVGPLAATSQELTLPDEWKSPLVSKYHYYITSGLSGDTYSPSNEITNLIDAGNGDIYVTYDVSNAIDLTGGKTYMLKFSDGVSFNQENGSDGILSNPTKAVYPYNNGEFHLYVYGQEQWESQLASGASTRTRWLWHIFSNHDGTNLTDNNIDPYHVIFKSEQNQTVKDLIVGEGSTSMNYPGNTYLRTYKPTGYGSVVTDVAYESQEYYTAYPSKMENSPWVNGGATEYMILGSSMLNMKLKTFNEIDGARQTVTSFEQYWKNNPTANNLLAAGGKAQVTANEETVSLSNEQRTFLESASESLHKDAWHSSVVWAYTKPWKQFNNGSTDKALKEGEHWFQTISMGSGNFTLEEVSLEPQVILLDQHGWEIMRVPLSDAAALRKYDSPMVKTYYWYPKAAKATGYHKYRVSDAEIVIYEKNDKNKWVDSSRRYTHTSTSLSDIPYDHITDPVQDASVKTDFYVTYDVKPLYVSAYTGAATASETEAAPFLLKQGGSYAKTDNGTSITTTQRPAKLEDATDNMQWYMKPNFNIDREMGYKYAGETGAQDDALSKNETEADYVDKGQNGFDPYNVQIQNKAYPLRYFTTNTSGSKLDGGVWTATTSTSVSLQNMTTTNRQTATGYDQTTLNITNATFMVVNDGNGNMRLMPRFDHGSVMTSFTALATQATAAAPEGDEGETTSLYPEMVAIPKEIHSSDEIVQMNGYYLLASDFTCSSSVGTETTPFKGTIDGQLKTIQGTFSKSLVAYADGAIIKNVIIEKVDINANDNVGAIVNQAKGATRIYNCGVQGGSVAGTAYTGGLVGLLDGEARVINCYNYADITGGSYVGGIVGYNNVATTSENLKTMVMNCMFYGDITGGTNKAPIYNGKIITNRGDQSGVGNFNYFRAEASYVQNKDIDTYNCALLAETRFLQRFEFFRHLLNSHRELAAWWATGDAKNKNEMMKWVLEPSQLGTSTPYPILKTPGYYPSVVNIDAENATTQTERNKGGLLGTLAVTIQMGSGGAQFAQPNGATITTPSLTLNITDKDPDHFNFNYYKVQLPYYNDVGTKNYTGNRVVTGWKIVDITDGTEGSFTTGNDATADADGEITAAPYNFADRKCTNKDLYSVSGRIFSQGAYWDVPEGVTAITIQPYWAKCVYLADAYADVTYNQAMSTSYNVPNVGGGQRYENGKKYNLETHVRDDTADGQIVYTSIGNALGSSALNPDTKHTVYDYTVVLVGNYHHYYNKDTQIGSSSPYTITSIDLDGDNEPDYSYILRFDGRCVTHPVRVDFLNIPGLGMAQKSTTGTGTYNFGIMIPKGWFESTNTSLFQFTQFEYEHSNRTVNDPLILQGGVMEQWVSNNQKGTSNKIPYIHVGGNVWFKEFHTGCHQDKKIATKHSPISVTGGDFDEFYLTGLYRADFDNYNDNLECYINGGRFGIVAGAAQEGAGNASNHTNGNVVWQIQNADINEFYGGGLNAVHPVEGNITTVIEGGYIKQFCGGPKFGDMNNGKTVKTTAANCKFDTYYGAGYGGNSYSRFTPNNINNINGDYGSSNWNTFLNNNYKQVYNSTYSGVSVTFFTQYIPMSNNTQNVARLLIDFVSFSLATTRNVTSKLTGCTITGNFYGGGSLGKVDGPVTSILDGCTVNGNVFGAGFSATLPTVDVMNTGGFIEAPFFNSQLGIYMDPTYPETVTYNWQQRTDGKIVNSTDLAIDKKNHILYTNIDLNKSNLGSVSGAVTLTLKGDTQVGTMVETVNAETNETVSSLQEDTGNVYGGGDQSYVYNTTDPATAYTIVTLQGNTIVYGDVFGGGNKGVVSGTTTVKIEE